MTIQGKLVRNKLGFPELASCLKNVSEACRVMGYSRDTFYRVRNAYEEGGRDALKEKNRRVPNPKNRIPGDVKKVLVELAPENPSLGPES